jgi:SAM-dependent methyltransferase
LFRADNALFATDRYRDLPAYSATPPGLLSRLVPDSSVNLSRSRVLADLRKRLDALGPCDVLVVGGGKQRIWLDPLLKSVQPHRVVYSDVDATSDVDIFCDAHDLPFVEFSFDAVITTAVLEHVLYPEKVASEIVRVLRPGGLLYSELPFMQQVHEGAYDFTRFSMSGHKRLFHRFSELDSGMVAGPATALVWALESLGLSFSRRPGIRLLVKAIVRLLFGWLRYIDYFLKNSPSAMDGASCTYFLGAKADAVVPDAEIIAGYVGGMYLSR